VGPVVLPNDRGPASGQTALEALWEPVLAAVWERSVGSASYPQQPARTGHLGRRSIHRARSWHRACPYRGGM